MTRISYLGPAGTVTEAALLAWTGAGLVPGADHQSVPADSTPAALEAVRAGAADYACVPIENSIEGGVTPTLDGLAAGSPLQVFAETTLDVAFSVVVAPGRAVADIRTVAAHPVAGAQVRRWLAEHLPRAHTVP
ncbi:MAG: prephenate dehydratase domain-containing protein, partial [Mycobacterium sp.]